MDGLTIIAQDSITARNGISCADMAITNGMQCTDIIASNSVSCSDIIISNSASCISMIATGNVTCKALTTTNVAASYMKSTVLSATTLNVFTITNSGFNISLSAKNLSNVNTINCNTFYGTTGTLTGILNCSTLNSPSTTTIGFSNKDLINIGNVSCNAVTSVNGTHTGTLYCSTFDSPTSITTPNVAYNIGFNNNNITNVANVSCNSVSATNGTYTGTLYCSTFNSPSSIPSNIAFNNNSIINVANLSCTYLSVPTISCTTVNSVTGIYSGIMYCAVFDNIANQFSSIQNPPYDFSFSGNNIRNVTNVSCTLIKTTQITGSGSGLTTLNATNVTTGTLPPAQLPTQLQSRTLWTPVITTTSNTIALNVQPSLGFNNIPFNNVRTYRFGVTYKYRKGDTNVALEVGIMYQTNSSSMIDNTTVYLEIYAVNGNAPLLSSSLQLNGSATYSNIQLPVSSSLTDNSVYWIALSDSSSNTSGSGHGYIMITPMINVYYV